MSGTVRAVAVALALVCGFALVAPTAYAGRREPEPVVATDRASERLAARVVARLGEVDARWGVYFRDLPSGTGFEWGAEQVFDAASVMKILVMMKTMRDIDDGRYALGDPIGVTDTFESAQAGAGTFVCTAKSDEVTEAIGGRMTVARLLHHMIVESDNLTTNVLMRAAGGPEAVHSHARLYGIERSRVRRFLMDKPALERGMVNRAQPREYGQLLEQIANAAVVSPHASRYMIELMLGLRRWWLGTELSRRVKIAHKTGAVRGVRHDAGLFFLPKTDRPYVLVVFSDRIKSRRDAEDAMADVGVLVYDHVLRLERRDRRRERRAPPGGSTPSDAPVPSSLPAPAPASGVDGPAVRSGNWFDQAAAVADRVTLAEAFSAAGYQPPKGTRVLAARVVPGVGQPAFRYYSLGDTAFEHSYGQYHPASAVKVMAAVGALWTLGAHGLSGDAELRFHDGMGAFHGTVRRLYERAITDSSNPAYNRLLVIAGFDEMNERYLAPGRGFPHLALQVGYGKLTRQRLHRSPEISFAEGETRGAIPAREGRSREAGCPRTNCATLFELQDVIRRVLLHDELPREERFPLQPQDVTGLRAALLAARDRLGDGPAEVLGHPVRIYNKVGFIPRMNLLETAMIEDTETNERFFVTALVPFPGPKEEIGVARGMLAELVRHTLMAVVAAPVDRGVALQREGGLPLDVELRPRDDAPGEWEIVVWAHRAEAVEGWVGGERLAPLVAWGPGFVGHHRFAGGDQTLVLRAYRDGEPVGYRALTVRLSAPTGPVR